MRKGFDKGFETSRRRLVEQLDLEAAIVDEVGKLVELLSATREKWEIRGGKVIFAEKATLARFNSHLAAINKMSARQDSLQKEGLESAKAKLEKLGK